MRRREKERSGGELRLLNLCVAAREKREVKLTCGHIVQTIQESLLVVYGQDLEGWRGRRVRRGVGRRGRESRA